MSLLASPIVVITGSSRGIGRACALSFAKHGASGLVLHYLGDEATTLEVESLKKEVEQNKGVKAIAVAGDIGDASTSEKVNPVFFACSPLTPLRSLRRASRPSAG
jgi:L-rhamnose 1-dehydrogenase